jgi:hypothetical protein
MSVLHNANHHSSLLLKILRESIDIADMANVTYDKQQISMLLLVCSDIAVYFCYDILLPVGTMTRLNLQNQI